MPQNDDNQFRPAPDSLNRALTDDIAALLREAILSGKLSPGQRLNQSELARRLHVSRAPVRESLQQLLEEGWVVNQPRRGMFVVKFEDDDLQRINSLRLLLEAEALRLCRLGVTPQNMEKIQLAAEQIESQGAVGALDAARIDLEFHQLIWSLTGNEYLERTLTSLTAPLFAYATLIKSKPTQIIITSHLPLADYIGGRSQQSAEEVIYAHIALSWPEPGKFASRPTGDAT